MYLKSLTLIAFLATASLACVEGDTQLTDKDVAAVGDVRITTNQFKQQMEKTAKIKNSRYFSEDHKKLLLNDMVDFQIVFEQAVNQKFHLQNDEVRQVIVREFLKENISEPFLPADEEVQAEYQRRQVDLDRIETSHILISTEKRTEEEARTLATKVRGMLLKGSKFEDLVMQYSDDAGSRGQLGHLGVINRKTGFVRPFLDGAFALKKVGDISPPVKSEFGFHLIRLEKDFRGLEKNRAGLTRQLANTKQKEAMQTLLAKLRDKAQVVLDHKKLKDINLTAVQIDQASATGETL